MKKILVVDDEPSIVTLLTFNLEKEGYQVASATDGLDGLQLALTETFDFIILDVMLPSLDGIEIMKRLRQEKNDTPILILTAKDDPIDRILGLEIGADDYLAKPFSPREVIARMKAIFRRMEPRKPDEATSSDSSNRIIVGEIQANLSTYQVEIAGTPIVLTPKEFELLIYFMRRKNHVIDRDTLLNQIWNFDFDGQTRIVDVHISHLREKIEPNPKKPQYLLTIRGFGYKFQDPTNG